MQALSSAMSQTYQQLPSKERVHNGLKTVAKATAAGAILGGTLCAGETMFTYKIGIPSYPEETLMVFLQTMRGAGYGACVGFLSGVVSAISN